MDSRSSENFFSFEQDDLLINSMPILQELRKTEVFCDIVVKAGNQEFLAHRPVLAATIPYFYTMLTSEFAESKQKEIVIKDIEPAILEALIDFSYSGKIKVDPQNVQKLMIAADFVELDQVKNACAKYLKSYIQADNVFGMIKLADLLNCQQLVLAADKFMEENFAEIAETNDFLMLEFEELRKLIVKDDITCSEEIIFEAAMKWIKHDAAERSSLFSEIFSKVRLSLVSTEFLTEVVSKEESIESSNECVRIVEEAKNYHLMKWENKLKPTSRYSSKFSNIIPAVTIKTLRFYDVIENRWLIHEEPLSKDGSVITSFENKIYVVGGFRSSFVFYNMETKKWSRKREMSHGRYSCGVTTFNDRIYLCGGIHPGGNLMSSVEYYSIKERIWSAVAPMSMPRYDLAVTSLNGYIYAVGGYNSDRLNFCEKYDPVSNTWTNIKPLLCDRDGPGIATLNDKIYVCGGSKGFMTLLNCCEVYDPSTDTWSYIAPMNKKRRRPTLTAINGKLYVVGGCNYRDGVSSVEVYSPETDSWKNLM